MLLNKILISLVAVGMAGCSSVGNISIKDTSFKRDGNSYDIIGKGIDWAVQPVSYKDYKKLVDKDSDIGINLYFAYGSPGLGKPLYVANDSGSPYKDNNTLSRNGKYWDEVIDRIKYANQKGISVVIANTFVDQGIFQKYSKDLIMSDWMETVKMFGDNYSAMFVPMSEYDEKGAGEKSASVAMSIETRNRVDSPVSLHPLKTSSKDVGSVDFIIHQGYDVNRIKSDLNFGKPIIIAEDQSAANNDDLKIKRFEEAKGLGAYYVFTGNNFGFSDKLAKFIKGQK